MAFKIKYSEMGTFQFQQALTKLVNAQISPSAAVIVSQLNKAIKKANIQVSNEYIKDIRDAFAPKDENGKILEGEEGKFSVPEDKRDDFKKAMEDFDNRELEIVSSPLYLRYFDGGKVTFSAEEIEALGPILVTLPTNDQEAKAGLRQVN